MKSRVLFLCVLLIGTLEACHSPRVNYEGQDSMAAQLVGVTGAWCVEGGADQDLWWVAQDWPTKPRPVKAWVLRSEPFSEGKCGAVSLIPVNGWPASGEALRLASMATQDKHFVWVDSGFGDQPSIAAGALDQVTRGDIYRKDDGSLYVVQEAAEERASLRSITGDGLLIKGDRLRWLGSATPLAQFCVALRASGEAQQQAQLLLTEALEGTSLEGVVDIKFLVNANEPQELNAQVVIDATADGLQAWRVGLPWEACFERWLDEPTHALELRALLLAAASRWREILIIDSEAPEVLAMKALARSALGWPIEEVDDEGALCVYLLSLQPERGLDDFEGCSDSPRLQAYFQAKHSSPAAAQELWRGLSLEPDMLGRLATAHLALEEAQSWREFAPQWLDLPSAEQGDFYLLAWKKGLIEVPIEEALIQVKTLYLEAGDKAAYAYAEQALAARLDGEDARVAWGRAGGALLEAGQPELAAQAFLTASSMIAKEVDTPGKLAQLSELLGLGLQSAAMANSPALSAELWLLAGALFTSPFEAPDLAIKAFDSAALVALCAASDEVAVRAALGGAAVAISLGKHANAQERLDDAAQLIEAFGRDDLNLELSTLRQALNKGQDESNH